MTDREQAQVSVITVRLGRLWVDYATREGMALGRRVRESARYVWLELTPREWRMSLCDVIYHIVVRRSGWSPVLAADPAAERIAAAAERAHRQLLCQSPAAWHDTALFLGPEPYNVPSLTLWLATINDDVRVVYLSRHQGSYEAVLSTLADDGPPAAYDPVRDADADDGHYGQAWRVWCIDSTVPGWMVEHTVRAIPAIVPSWDACRGPAAGRTPNP